MIAGLERDIGGGPTRARAGFHERGDFGVGLAIFGMPPFADDPPVLHDYRADLGIGRNPTRATLGEFEGATHEADVVVRRCGQRPVRT